MLSIKKAKNGFIVGSGRWSDVESVFITLDEVIDYVKNFNFEDDSDQAPQTAEVAL